MIILISGASHTGKTLLAQKLLEKYKYPVLSIDLLKMGLIRSNNTSLTPEDDEKLSPIKDIYNVIINAIDAQSKSKFDIIILDETQRINTTQLDLILKFVRDNQLKCIISYDPIQTLSYMEKNSKAISHPRDIKV